MILDMEQRFIKKENNPRLLLFFAGWGSDEHLFSRSVEDGYDYLLCFDYRTLDFDYSLLDGYREIRLLAWSMGVWVAGQVLTGKDYPWQMRLAVGGTPFPIDDRKGIPEAIFRATLENFSDAALVRFRRRICGTAEQVKEFLSHAPYRPVPELHEELQALEQYVRRPSAPFVWDKAIIGTDDKIFPPANQREAWRGTAVIEKDVAHYGGALFDRLLSGEEAVWTRH